MKKFDTMYKISILSLFLLFIVNINAQQWEKAFLKEDMSVGITKLDMPSVYTSKSNINQLQGFPIAVPANPSFKNMRNLSLADMNNDGKDDIIFAVDNKLYVYTYQGLLWQQDIIGTAVYPPSIGDVDGDGELDIVQLTGGVPANGRIYVLDKTGNILPGWPVNLNNNWLICAPALSDLDADNKLEIIFNERISPAGNVHILKYDGSSFNSNWPVALDGIPAITPSVGDVDGDGQKDIIAYSTKSRYILGLDGQANSGFPLTTAPNQSYSYQSPVIADFNNDNYKEIVGSTHGDAPQYYIMRYDNTSYPGWPLQVPDDMWTYSPPTVVKINSQWHIFMSRPTANDTLDMLYGWDENGNILNGFPIVKQGGLEGYISVADITNDNDYELIFGSNLKDNNGYGFIHGYKMNGSGQLPDFPLKPKGFTFMNGVSIADINGDGNTELVALSYNLNFGAEPDSSYINVYELNTPYHKNKVLWGTYKGSNTRTGLWEETFTSANDLQVNNTIFKVFPNPASTTLTIDIKCSVHTNAEFILYNNLGQVVMSKNIKAETKSFSIAISNFKTGFYNYVFNINNKPIVFDKLVIIG